MSADFVTSAAKHDATLTVSASTTPLRSVITPLLIGVFAFQFNNFNVIYLLTSGNPAVQNSDAGGTDILISYTYKLTLQQQRFAVAAAYSVIIFMIVGGIAAVQMRSSGSFSEAKT